jgi:lipopolysaccharide transport system ATP-binding protein
MGMSRTEIAGRIDAIAEFSGLGEFIDMPFRTYSSGMQLRLAFAASTSIRPEILVLDEWLSTGDEDFKRSANERLRQMFDTTRIVVLASHSQDLLHEHCNRVVWMERGAVHMDGPAREVLDAYFSSR